MTSLRIHRYRHWGLILAAGLVLAMARPARLLAPGFAAALITQPDGVADQLAEGADYATRVLADPWDMDQRTDLYLEKARNLASIQVAGGEFSARSTTSDPYLYVVWPGYVEPVLNIGPYGINHPIDANRFTRLSFRLYLSAAGEAQVFWFRDAQLKEGAYGSTRPFRAQAGWHVYELDLPQSAGPDGGLAWSGAIQGLRLDPASLADVDVRLDWIRLTDPNEAAALYTARWSNSAASALVNLYADTDANWNNGVYAAITRTADFAPGQFAWPAGVLPPGDYYVAAESGNDYASLVLDQAWDMDQPADVGLLSSAGQAAFSNGILAFDTINYIPYFWPRYDHLRPIDAGRFTRFTMRMYSSQPSAWRVSWWTLDERSYDSSAIPEATSAGWHTYTLDLAGRPGWDGLIRNLVVRPAYTEGVHIEVDWAALSPGVEITDESQLGAQLAYSPGPLSRLPAPTVRLTRPSPTTGPDYAARVLGDAWDMRTGRDVLSTFDVFDVDYNGGVLNALSGVSNDAQVNLPIRNQLLDADRFRYLTYRLYVEGRQDTVYGWVARLLWRTPTSGWNATRGLVINEGWNTYSLDLSRLGLESASALWGGQVAAVRFDPHETLAPTAFHLDEISLRAPDEADQSFNLQWEGTFSPGAQVDLYFDLDTDPAARTLIVAGLPAAARNYLWDTSAVPAGAYYVYCLARDAYQSVGSYSLSPVVIQHPAGLGAVLEPPAAPPFGDDRAAPERISANTAAPKWAAYTDLSTVLALAREGEVIWLGTRGGVVRWDPGTDERRIYTTVDGLAHNTVTGLALAPDGERWFATLGGVSRFSAAGWRSYTRADGLPDDHVLSVALAADGAVWFGTERGLSRFDGAAFTTYTTADGLPDDAIRALAFDQQGALWAGTDGGLARLAAGVWVSYTAGAGLASDYVWSIAADPAGGMWFGTDSGVSHYLSDTWTVYTTSAGLPANYVRGLASGVTGTVWAATQAGLAHFDGQAWAVYTASLGAPWQAVAADAVGRVWAGGPGLAWSDGAQWSQLVFTASVSANHITSLARDAHGGLWAGSYRGAAYFDGQTWRQYSTTDGLLSNAVQDIAVAPDGVVWFATEAGLSRWQAGQWRSFTSQDGLVMDNLTSVAVDQAGRIWCGTWLGVSVYDGVNWITFNPADYTSVGSSLDTQYVYDILVAADGAVWLATLDGAHRYQSGVWTTYRQAQGLVDSRVTGLTLGPNGDLWLSTYAGVSRFDGVNWTNWPLAQVGGLARSIQADDLGRVWVGTYGNGLAEWDGSTWRQFTRRDGLAGEQVLALQTGASGGLWVGTLTGLNWLPEHRLYLPALQR